MGQEVPLAHTVLVVDDSIMIRRMVGQALVGAGYEVVQAVDGREALETLQAGLRPDLVVCDVNMPRMNGLEFLEELASDDALKHLLVVMLTTEGEPELVREARRLGAKAWLLKPFQPSMLLLAAEGLLRKAA